ncbi:MAG: ribonuclease J [Chloroflexi bacterium]|nr:ribonuclease J [Chloroflexota bacterium]MBM3173276.1 ribonuclease J [Chloroflexota bacterium]MBM3175126.1 ribonuclease J [Chloroflexota bacterium]MBM4449781.1 ribonuclease J [Chloroflexota bacterium]
MGKHKLRIIPLGGLGEIGKNMMAIEYGNDIVVVDAGLMFPEEDMHGVDLVVPDISYLQERREKLRGIILTHGHEDHIGALPYVLPQLGTPLYGTKLTQGLVTVKLKEHRYSDKATFKTIQTGQKYQLGNFTIEPFSVCHSIPDSIGYIIHTPIGVVVHSGDFKVDYTPVDSKPTDLTRLAQLGTQGVLLLLADSTYAELPGYTPSESVVGETLDHIIANAPGRVIIATFSSLISRIQQVINAAAKHDRHVFIIGRSMKNTTKMAAELGYLNIPTGVVRQSDELHRFPHDKIVLLTTGSQGEPTSALVRIANHDNSQVRITRGDTVVMSATPVPGNETLVHRTVDTLFRQGAQVIYEKLAQVHVHGHGSQEELKLLLNLVKPKFFIPIHGEYRHLSLHAKLAKSLGMPESNIFVIENGSILELDRNKARVTDKVPAGNVYVDGLVMGDLAKVVLRDRKMLSRDGIVVVIVAIDKKRGKVIGRPDIVSRGFVDTIEGETILEQGRDLVATTLDRSGGRPLEWSFINTKVKDTLGKFFYEQTKRRPMILTTTMEV